MMLQGHFIDSLLDPIYKDQTNNVFIVWSYLRGITAPTFFTISGLVFMYLLLKAQAKGDDKPRIKKGLYRGLLLLLIGYSLRMNIFSLFSSYLNPNAIVIDVLQCIGVSLILLVVLYMLFKKYSYLLSFLLAFTGIAIFLCEPLYRELSITSVPKFIANYVSKENGSVFTILPWFGFSAFGGWLATVFFRHAHRPRFKLLTIIAFFVIGYFLLFYSSWFLIKLYNITNFELLNASAYYNYLFTRFGNVLIIFAIFYTFERFLKQSIITQIGEKTLSIYVIHFVIIFGSYTGYGLKRYFGKSLDPTEAIIGALLFTIVVCIISFNYVKTNAFVYNAVRKFVGRFAK